jgi:hypothetical protein
MNQNSFEEDLNKNFLSYMKYKEVNKNEYIINKLKELKIKINELLLFIGIPEIHDEKIIQKTLFLFFLH